MLEINKDWGAILAQYEVSNLSQNRFCKLHGLSWNQFRYRWDRHHSRKKSQEKALVLENCPIAPFESVVIKPSFPEPKEESSIAEVSIHLPNQIRCDVKVNFNSNTLTTLLKQLVTLC